MMLGQLIASGERVGDCIVNQRKSVIGIFSLYVRGSKPRGQAV